MTITRSTLYGFIGLSIIALVYLMVLTSGYAKASAPAGAPATVATTSQEIVSQTVSSTAIATSSCTARIITTTTKPVMISFSDFTGLVPTGILGHLQSASTTVTYDSGLYGCGAFRIYGFDANSNITVTDVR